LIFETLSVRNRHGSLVGKHTKPKERLFIQRLPTEQRQNSKPFFTKNERVSSESTNSFTPCPIWPGYPLVVWS
jgi:hypothetical protein